MATQCSPEAMPFARLDRREVVADFDDGAMSSDAGALLLGATDRAIGLLDRFAACFADGRAAGRIEHAPVAGHRYRMIAHDPEVIAHLIIDLFLDAHGSKCDGSKAVWTKAVWTKAVWTKAACAGSISSRGWGRSP